MHVRKLPLKQKLFIDFLVLFLFGIVLANLLGADSFQKNSSLTRYYLKQFQYAEIRTQELLWHVACSRLALFAVVLALGLFSKTILFHALFVAWSGFSYGYFCVLAISAFGAKGLILCVLALFPQFIVYIPVYLGLVQLSERRREHTGWKKFAAVICLLIGMVAGILLESYINPLILQKVLKIF